jgi:DNA-binding transcriptional LysR family regulator
MDRFDAMQAFARVVEAGSFTKAAETLHMSKTSVTQLVQQLEARLRVRCSTAPRARSMSRPTARPTTSACCACWPTWTMPRPACPARRQPRGRLRVDVPSPLARMILVPALPAFHARYPDIQLDMGVSDRMVDLIGENVDCVVRGGELPTSRWWRAAWATCGLGVYARRLPGARRHARASARAGRHAPPHRGLPRARTGKPIPYAHAPRRRKHHRAGPPRVLGRRRQRLPRGRPGRPGRAVAARLHGQGARGAGELVPLFTDWQVDPDAAVHGLSAPTAMSAPSCACSSIGWRQLMAQHAPVTGPQGGKTRTPR